jgi:GTP-binding protein Era
MSHFGTVALIGRSNVGKSTLLNAALDEPLAIVSPLPQTTRTSLLGIVNRGEDQIAFLDTPGIHQARSELGRRMNSAAIDSLRHANVIVYVTDVSCLLRPAARQKVQGEHPTVTLDPNDVALIETLPKNIATILVINKVDLVGNKQRLLPLIETVSQKFGFAAVVPVSCLSRDDVERVLSAVVTFLPEGEAQFPKDEITDRPVRYFVAEYVREQVLLATHREVPHAVAVTVDNCVEDEKLLHAAVTLHVEKDGQRRILVGRGGQMVRDIGTNARARIMKLVGKKVRLELFVKTNPGWKSVPRQLAELGYVDSLVDATSAQPKGSE